MYIYWKISCDLEDLGMGLTLVHPNLQREFKRWAKRNLGGLTIAMEISLGEEFFTPHPSMN